MRFGVDQAFAALATGVDAAQGVLPRELSDDQLARSISKLHASEQRLASTRAKLLAEFDARQACRGEGSLTTGSWMVRELHVSRGDTYVAERAAKVVRDRREFAEAFAAGEVTSRHIDLVGQA